MLSTFVALLVGGTAVPQDGRRVPTESSKIFTFNAEQLGKWNNHFGVDSSVESARRRNRKGDELVTRDTGDRVTVEGNFAFTFTATGPGTTTSAIQTNDITITTNQQLTLTTSDFGSLVDAANVSQPNAGSVEYEFSIRRNNSTVAGPETGTDAGANGKTLSVPDPPGASSRTYQLRIRRRVTLTEEGKGSETYTSSGRINLVIN